MNNNNLLTIQKAINLLLTIEANTLSPYGQNTIYRCILDLNNVYKANVPKKEEA